MRVAPSFARGGQITAALAAAVLGASVGGGDAGRSAAAPVVMIVVTRTDDPAPDGCLPDDCSLREAVIAANGSIGDVEISLPPGLYQLSIPGADEDSSLTGDLDILRSLIIGEDDSATTIIDGGKLDRVMQAHGGLSEAFLMIGVTVRGGAVTGDGGGILMGDKDHPVFTEFFDVKLEGNSAGGDGGGAWIAGDASFEGCAIAKNSAANGGGVSGPMFAEFRNCEIADNVATGDGGGIHADIGMVLVNQSTIARNSARSGGALHHAEFGDALIVDSTIEDNLASDYGGAFLVHHVDLTVETSTIAGNRASFGGAVADGLDSAFVGIARSTVNGNEATDGGAFWGVLVSLEDTTVSGNMAERDGGAGNGVAFGSLLNATITGNMADSDLDGSGAGGAFASSLVEAANTIVAGNRAGAKPNECAATVVTSGGHNLIESYASCLISGDTWGNVLGVDPLLGPLANNGGPAATHGLMVGSPAIDAGNPPAGTGFACTVQDQRGIVRTQGSACDIGAFEFIDNDSDGDGCHDGEETGAAIYLGGGRNPFDLWDFYDVTADQRVDLSDTLAILEKLGLNDGDIGYMPDWDRSAPDPTRPWRTAKDTSGTGIDLTDALVNLDSFGHDCTAPP